MIDKSRLQNIKFQGSKIIAQCPACAESGADKQSNHLFINEDGKFGCVLHQGAEGADHRKRIFELIGISEAKTPKKRTYTAQPHAPTNQPLPDLRHYKHGRPTKHWIYRTPDGNVAGIVCRFDLTNGKKETLPMTWCKDDDRNHGWEWKAMREPRPLYNLPITSDIVVVVEGEKCAEAVIQAGYHAVTWSGGCSAIAKSDFSPLHGKQIILWPDNDEPGIKAMDTLRAMLVGKARSIKTITPPDDKPQGWDAADTDEDEISRLISTAEEPKPAPPPPVAPRHDDRVMDLPFRLLGVDGDQFFYMPDRGHQIVSLSASSHSKPNLMRLAPLNCWEAEFPSKSGADWDCAVNALIQKSQSMPKFDPRRIRGRGCWIDGRDVVFHAGDRLVVNGRHVEIPDYRSSVRAIYEGALEIEVDSADHAPNAQAAKVIELCEMLSWERPLYGKLLAGWLALAPVSGALSWRPHLWVTGPSGSGKSWTVANIIQPLVGETALHVQGNTSEAGIRGQLGSDALPVVFDEAESEDKQSQQRFNGVLELARQASTETGAGIVKGTAQGGSITYLIRSCFLFASIGVAAVKKADVSRITVLPLTKNTGPQGQEQFEAIKALWRETIGQDGFCEKIRSRSLRHAMIIRANAEIFSGVAVEFTGDKRSADQFGTLLAGAFSLTSTKEITKEAARAWMAKQDWAGFKSEEVDNDENQCLSHLFAASIRFELMGAHTIRSVSEIVEELMAFPSYIPLEPDAKRKHELEHALIRHGMRMDDGGIYVANRHQAMEGIFADTPWAGAKWRLQLERVPGAVRCDTMSFGKNVRQRAVWIPTN
jgi:putative DNA primase/helicase